MILTERPRSKIHSCYFALSICPLGMKPYPRTTTCKTHFPKSLTANSDFKTKLYNAALFPWSFFDNNSNTGAQIDYRHLHLGFGMTSSGTGVQIDSGDFCSLNLPSNTAASCSMSKAHTAEPGMLQRQRRAIDKNTLNWHRMAQCQQAVRSNEAVERRSDGKEKMR